MTQRDLLAVVVIGLLASASDGAADIAADAAAEAAPPRAAWRVRPALYAFGSLDSIGGEASEAVRQLAEPSPTASLAASTDVVWNARRGRLQASTFGLAGSPASDGERSVFLAGRLHGLRSLGTHWRLTLDDVARFQRHATARLTDFQRHEGQLGLEWQGPRRTRLGLRLADRRREVPELDALGFRRQGLTLALGRSFGSASSLELNATRLRYSTRTSEGQRSSVSCELARFQPNGVAALRAGWFGGGSERLDLAAGPGPTAAPIEGGRIYIAPVYGPAPLAADVSESQIGVDGPASQLEAWTGAAAWDTLDPGASGGLDLTGDPFLFDPLEADSDEWDFGRRKLVVVGFVTRRLGERWRLSGLARYQHKRGPNLLASGGDRTTVFEDERVALRLGAQRRVGARVTLFAQACHLRSWGDRPALRFSRTMAAVGIQVR